MPALPRLDNTRAAQTAPVRSLVSWLGGTARRNLVSVSTASEGNVVRRQITGLIPTYYQGMDTGPSGGTVVGIVLGSVAGFLLIVWLLYTLAGQGGNANIAGEEEIVVRRRDRSRSPRSRRSRRSTRTEVRQVSRSPRRREIIVEERTMPPHPRPRSRSILVEERIRVPGDDVVEVIEEHSDIPPRRQRSRRNSGYRSVDPDLYAGGNYPQQHVPRSRRYS